MYRHGPADAGVDGGTEAEVGRTDLPDMVPGSWASFWFVSLDRYPRDALGLPAIAAVTSALPLEILQLGLHSKKRTEIAHVLWKRHISLACATIV